MSALRVSHLRQIRSGRGPEFVAKGFRPRHVFPHRLLYLPKAGPDGLKAAERMCGVSDPNRLWEIVLYADPDLVAAFPSEVFFDDDVVWHRQHFGRPGQVATANLVAAGARLYTMNHQSDLVQRISRRRELKTRVENRFKGWHHMLLNGLMSFAGEAGFAEVLTPTAALALRHTDPKRRVGPELFERVYDLHPSRLYRAARRDGWWVLDVEANRDRIVPPERIDEPLPDEKTICVCHDVERGLGHLDVDPAFARVAERESPAALDGMLEIERRAGVRATYNVLGLFLPEVRRGIEDGGHCLGFHSWDHAVDGAPEPQSGTSAEGAGPGRSGGPEARIEGMGDLVPGDPDPEAQLESCRRVDYRVKGYRPPRSRIPPKLTDRLLVRHNFEWLASSVSSLGLRSPRMEHRLVKIPILFDDFPLYRDRVAFGDWEARALELVRGEAFVAFGLHDCYARWWLPHYPRFLEAVRGLGVLRTLDEVAFTEILASPPARLVREAANDGNGEAPRGPSGPGP